MHHRLCSCQTQRHTRFYVNFDDANDQISAVFGNADFPLEVNVPKGRSTRHSTFGMRRDQQFIRCHFPNWPTTLSPPWAWQTGVHLGIEGAADPSSRKTQPSRSRRFSHKLSSKLLNKLSIGATSTPRSTQHKTPTPAMHQAIQVCGI